MMRVILHETLTGNFVDELEFVSVTASNGVCRPDSVRVKLPGYTGEDLYQYMIPRKYSLTVVDDYGYVTACGVLGIPTGDTDDDGINYVTMSGTGIESVFARQPILPYPYWPLVNDEGYPITSKDTVITGVEYGTMMKRLYQQAVQHPGMELPVVFEADRVGTRQNSYSAVDGIMVQNAVDNITRYVNGIEYDWVPVLDSNENLKFHLKTGTDSSQEITPNEAFTWNHGGSDPDIRGLSVQVSPEFMVSTAVFTGGKEDDRVLLGRSVNPDISTQNIPAATLWDSSHSSVSDVDTLSTYADKAILEGEAPVQYWSFDVRNDRSVGLRGGTYCYILVEDHWLLPNGMYPRRVLSVEHSSDDSYARVTVAGEMTW